MFARLAAGFAAIVILGGGSYLGIKYAGTGFCFQPGKSCLTGSTGKNRFLHPGRKILTGIIRHYSRVNRTLAAEAPASESGVAGSQSLESSADASKSGQSSSASNQDSGQSDKYSGITG